MAQQTFEELADAVKQAESRGKRYGADGKTLTTSAKGALGEMQVMPKTVRDPGFGVAPAKDKSPDEIARVGRDYLQAMLGKYGDKNKALIAYNMGPGSTDKWIAAGEKLDKLPEETRTYVQRVNKLLGRDVPRETTVVKKPREPSLESLPPMAATPTVKPEAAERVASLGPGYQAALALSFLADTDEPEGDTTATQEFMAKRQEERDAAEEAALLQEQAARPAVLAELSDTKIRSPFAAPQPQKMAGGGLPYVPTSRISSSARKQLDDVKAEYEKYNTEGDAYNKSVAAYNASERTTPFTNVLPAAPSITPEQYQAMATAASKSARARNLALQVASNPEQFNFSMDNFFADGGEARALLTSFVKRAEGSPEEGEVAPRMTMQQIEALAARDAAEREEASKPIFGLARTPSSGIGRTAGPVSNALNSGDAYIAAAKGVTEMPYNLLGAPMDLVMLARQGLTGLPSTGQAGTSEYIKKKATELGIRPAPPTDPTLRGFYDVGDIGSSMVNPASVTRAAARGASALAQKTGEAAKMLEDVTVGNIQRGRIRRAGEQVPPDTAYDPLRERMETQGNLALAVRNKDTPYPMQAGVPADRPFVGRLDSFVDTLKGPVQFDQLKGQLKGKFRDYDIERVERAFPGMDEKTKLTPDQIKQALAGTFSPSRYVSETLPLKTGAYFQNSDNVWGTPLGTTNLYLAQAPEALEANALLRKATQVFSPFMRKTTNSTFSLEDLSQARGLLTSPEILKVVDPALVTNLSKTFDKVEKNVGLIRGYSETIKNVSNGFAYPVLYIDKTVSMKGPNRLTSPSLTNPFFEFEKEAMNVERTALEQKFLAEGLDPYAAISRVHTEIMDNFQLYYQKSRKIAAQKVQELAIAEAQKNGITLPDVSLIKWDELSEITQPVTNPAFKQSLENALEPSRVTVNNAVLNIKNVMDPEIKKVGDILYQRGNLYEGNILHVGVAGKPYPIGFTRFSEHETVIPNMGVVQGRHFHELQSDLSRDMRNLGTTSGSAAKDQLAYDRLQNEVQQARQKAIDKLQESEAKRQILINEGGSRASFQKIEDENDAVRTALNISTRATEKRISILGTRIRKNAPYSLEEPFAGFETNQMVRQQLLMKNAIQSTMRDGKSFATFPGAESNQPTLYVGKILPNLKQVIKDLGGEKSGLELRQIELPPAKDGRPITAYGVTWSPEAAARIVKNGIPFAKGGMVERQSTDNRRYL